MVLLRCKNNALHSTNALYQYLIWYLFNVWGKRVRRRTNTKRGCGKKSFETLMYKLFYNEGMKQSLPAQTRIFNH